MEPATEESPELVGEDEPETCMRDLIADAAIAVIARDGFDALSVRRVAAEASVTGGTVQHHYPTKVALTVAALDRTVRRQEERVASVGRALPAGPLERFLDELCVLLPTDDASTEEAVVWIAMSAAVPGHPFVAERQRRASEQTRRWMGVRIRSARDAGEIDDVDPREFAPLVEAALDGMLQQAVAAPDLTHDEAGLRLRTMVERLLRTGTGPAAASRRVAR